MNNVKVIISGDSASLQSALCQANASMGQMRNSMEMTERASQALTASVSRMGHVAAGALSVQGLVTAADAWSSLNAQLRVATGSSLDAERAYASVLSIAMQSGQSLDTIGTVYRRFADNATALGLSQEKVAQVTETVAQSIALSGGSAESSNAALVQFGQALASGVLRGEEFNSVMEQAPRLAKTLADGLGVPIGSLRAMAEQGKITSDEIIRALTDQSARVSDEFGKLPVTIGRAMTNLRTAFTDTVGSFEKSTGVFSTVASGVDAVAKGFDGVVTAGQVLAALMAGRFIASTATAVQQKYQMAIAASAAKVSYDALGVAIQRTAATATLASRALAFLGGPIGLITTALSAGAAAWLTWGDRAEKSTGDAARSAAEKLDSIIQKLQDVNSRLEQTSRKAFDFTVSTAESELKTVRASINQLQTELDSLDASGGRGRFSDAGKDKQSQLEGLVKREISLQSELATARSGAANVGIEALNRFVDANAVGADKIRVKQEKLLTDFSQAIANTGGVLDLGNAAHKKAYDALNAGLSEAAKPSASSRPENPEFARMDFLGDLHKNAAQELENHRKEAEQLTKANAAMAQSVDGLTQAYAQRNQTAAEALLSQEERELAESLRAVSERAQVAREALSQKAAAMQENSAAQAEYQRLIGVVNAAETAQIATEKANHSSRLAMQSDWTVGAGRAFRNYRSQAMDVAGATEQAFSRAFGSMEDMLVTFVQTGKLDFSSFANSIISDLIRIQIRASMTQMLGGASGGGGLLGALASGVSGLFGNFGTAMTYGTSIGSQQTAMLAAQDAVFHAKGGVYQSPSLSAYSGGVYDSPQVFAFAKGAGVFAEAGPEAIMPLQRDSRGRLGVTASGGAGPQSIRVSIHNEGKPQEVVSAQPRFDLEGMVIDVVTRDLATEGTIAKGMQARYGLSRAAGAYG